MIAHIGDVFIETHVLVFQLNDLIPSGTDGDDDEPEHSTPITRINITLHSKLSTLQIRR